ALFGWSTAACNRQKLCLAPLAWTGLSSQTPLTNAASELPALGGRYPLDAAALGVSAQNLREGRASEVFDLRTPQHITLAGDLGLGVFDRERIDLRNVSL